MKSVCIGIALMLTFTGCTSGLFANQATNQVDKAELFLLKDTLTKGARAQATYFVEVGRFASDINELDLSVPEGIAPTSGASASAERSGSGHDSGNFCPALMAGLPGSGSIVWVGPPLFWRGLSRGFSGETSVPTKSPLAFGLPAGK